MTKPFPPLISICHATARPDGWQATWANTQAMHSGQEFYEYILCMDERHQEHLPRLPYEYHRTILNTGKQSCNTAFNVAASVSSGKIIVLMADDCFLPAEWDLGLLNAVLTAGKSLDDDFVIWVGTGNTNDAMLMLVPILSRARYLRMGYAIWPYPSVYADNEFTEDAQRDPKCIIDVRDRLKFEHRHFTVAGGMPYDDVYAQQNSNENYAKGLTILNQRRAEGFPPDPNRIPLAKPAKVYNYAPGVTKVSW